MPEEKRLKPMRNSALEIPRIIAMIFIVFSHYAVHGVGNLEGICTEGSFNYYLLKNATLNVGTDTFILIFGFFCINSIFSGKKVAKLWISVWSWSLILYPIAVGLGRGFHGADLEKVLMPVIFNEYWFFTAYTVLFLFTPFINRGLKALSRRDFGRLLALMLVLWSALPMIEGTVLYGANLLQLLMVYSIGAYMRLYPDCLARKRKTALALMIGCAAVLVVGLYLYIHVFNLNTFYLRQRCSLLVVGFTTGLISFCASLKPFHCKPLNWFAGSMFGVYLIHENPFLKPYIWRFFRVRDHADSPDLFFHMLLVTGVIIVAGVLLDKVKSALIDRPVGKLIDAYHVPAHSCE